MKGTIALVDDHVLLRNGLASLLQGCGYKVMEADNGKHFIETLKENALPQLVLMDINMPLMDGYKTTAWLKNNHPSVKVLALSMFDNEEAIIKMIRSGAKGYLLKDTHPEELEKAIDTVLKKGFYHSELISGKLIQAISHSNESSDKNDRIQLNEKEIEFLKWVCTDYSYKEIAEKMKVSPRTIDDYRDNLQEKLECKGRIGIVLWAIKNGYVII